MYFTLGEAPTKSILTTWSSSELEGPIDFLHDFQRRFSLMVVTWHGKMYKI